MTDPEEIWRSAAYRHPTPWATDFPALSLVEMFEQSARPHADKPLIDFLGRHYSYAETWNGANRVAAGLAALGYGPGDRIGLFLPNVPHYLAAYFGILKLGATVVNFSPLYTVEELAHQVEDSGTRVLFTLSASALLPTALKVLDQVAYALGAACDHSLLWHAISAARGAKAGSWRRSETASACTEAELRWWIPACC